MYVGGFRISKNSYFINNKPLFLKPRIFTNLNTVFPVLALVFYFEEFSEEVLHHCMVNGLGDPPQELCSCSAHTFVYVFQEFGSLVVSMMFMFVVRWKRGYFVWPLL
jgi:hypothetical protein